MRGVLVIGLVGGLAGAAALAAPRPKEPAKGALYLPSTVNDKLVYEETVNGTRRVEERWVVGAEKEDGLVAVAFSGAKGGGSLYRWGASADGLFGLSNDPEVAKKPYRLLRLPVKAGDTWEEEPRSDDDDPTTQFRVVKAEEVEVPAGKFTAVRVEAVCQSRTHVGKQCRITYWFAPGVGMVKKVARGPGVDEVRVLKSFTPGEK